MSSSGVFGPPPPGIDLSKTQDDNIIKAVVSLMVIGTIFVALRIFARTIQKGVTLDIDDYLVILGLVSSARLHRRSEAHKTSSYLHMELPLAA
jgi:hypothetical protein